MKQYTADKHAQYTLQIATPIVTAVLIGLIWYFLAVLPHWLLWTLTAVLAAAAILLSTLLLPMWFCTVTYCVSATHITRKCGIFFHTGASHADIGVAVQQHFSGTLC